MEFGEPQTHCFPPQGGMTFLRRMRLASCQPALLCGILLQSLPVARGRPLADFKHQCLECVYRIQEGDGGAEFAWETAAPQIFQNGLAADPECRFLSVEINDGIEM